MTTPLYLAILNEKNKNKEDKKNAFPQESTTLLGTKYDILKKAIGLLDFQFNEKIEPEKCIECLHTYFTEEKIIKEFETKEVSFDQIIIALQEKHSLLAAKTIIYASGKVKQILKLKIPAYEKNKYVLKKFN